MLQRPGSSRIGRSRLANLGCWLTGSFPANRSRLVAETFHGHDGLPYILVRPPPLEGMGPPQPLAVDEPPTVADAPGCPVVLGHLLLHPATQVIVNELDLRVAVGRRVGVAALDAAQPILGVPGVCEVAVDVPGGAELSRKPWSSLVTSLLPTRTPYFCPIATLARERCVTSVPHSGQRPERLPVRS